MNINTHRLIDYILKITKGLTSWLTRNFRPCINMPEPFHGKSYLRGSNFQGKSCDET